MTSRHDGGRLPAAYLTSGSSSFHDFLRAHAPEVLPSGRRLPSGASIDAPHGTTIVAITFDEGGSVTYEIAPGEERYESGIANDITSASYGPWNGSFLFPDAPTERLIPSNSWHNHTYMGEAHIHQAA